MLSAPELNLKIKLKEHTYHIPQVTIQPTNPIDPPTTVTHTQIISEFTTFYKTILGTPSSGLLNLCLEALYPQPNPDFLQLLVDSIFPIGNKKCCVLIAKG
jgi:hypothetical protein